MSIKAITIEIKDLHNNFTVTRRESCDYNPHRDSDLLTATTVQSALRAALTTAAVDWNGRCVRSEHLRITCFLDTDENEAPFYTLLFEYPHKPAIEIMGRKFIQRTYADILRFVGACNND